MNRETELLERLTRALTNQGHADGLKPVQWESLRFLALANDYSSTPTGLGAYLGVTKGTVSQTLNALERKALIARTPDPKDGRKQILALTEQGRACLAGDPLQQLDGVIAVLPKPTRDGLSVALEKVLAALIAQRGGRAFEECRSCRFFADEAAGHRCRLLNVPLTEADSRKHCIEHQ